MQTIKSSDELTKQLVELKAKGKKIGFVPTMGSLHEGHMSLVRKARKDCGVVVVSIFVNPTQFGPKEDFKRYPRNLKQDAQMLTEGKADFLFAPSGEDIYPKGFRDYISPGPLANGLCGGKRPGHFRGVATVVNRLFQIVPANVAYFGQKDYQQARVVQSMVARRNIPIEIEICPTVREEDGLAMSSRNAYLSEAERVRAKSIAVALRLAHKMIRNDIRKPSLVRSAMMEVLKPNTDKIDYIAIVDTVRLKPLYYFKGEALIAVACYIGKTRLIDNMLIRV